MTSLEVRTALNDAGVREACEAITELLLKAGRVAIRDFGIFELHQQKARRARNPRTGGRVNVPAKVVVKFKPAKALRRRTEQLPGVPDGA
jgi:nucleoid DNA-binding protein